MGRIPGYYEWDDDALSPGLKREGGLHQNLFDDDGKLRGSARFVPDDLTELRSPITETVYVPVEQRRLTREEEELAEAISQLVARFIDRGIAAARPHAERWWRESAKPAIEAQRIKISERVRRRSGRSATADREANALGPSQRTVEASNESRPRMSRAEAQARYLAALAATAYSDEQMRLVAEAEIVEGGDLDELRRSLAQLPVEQVRELIARMAKNPAMLGEDTLAELASLLGRRAI